MGKKTQKKFLDIEFNQVQCKTQEIRLCHYTTSFTSNGLFLLSLVNLLECTTCPNEGGASPIYINQLRSLITQQGRLLLATKAESPRKTKKYILIIVLWVLLT